MGLPVGVVNNGPRNHGLVRSSRACTSVIFCARVDNSRLHRSIVGLPLSFALEPGAALLAAHTRCQRAPRTSAPRREPNGLEP